MDPVERLFFYCYVDPAAAFPLPAAFVPHALTHFFPLAGTLSPAARCFSYSSGHDALDLVLASQWRISTSISMRLNLLCCIQMVVA